MFSNIDFCDRILWVMSVHGVEMEGRGSFKLNVDVAFNTSNGRFGAGLVFRDDRGSIVDAAAVRLNGSGSVEVAEAGAILEGFFFGS
ncbi:hypothetical protein LWI29_013069 [Acer saccharum]|uniref:RNase H type-1 domain-containing protein n=1 Tax=Acer saccharum TaxID=4024 RepID=A0AA39TFE0_ACESA|nr:hypothetical protein LWI29_013069 [Acer saccharum]